MGKKYRHVINILLASTLYLNSIFYLPAFAQSTTGTSPTWEIKASELQSNLMVNTTGSPDHVVKKKLIWAMSFSIFGGLSALACQNLKAYDVDLWVLGGAYYTVRALMLKSKETKVAEAIANAQKQETQYYQENPDIKAQREKQIKPLEQILEAQRQAISLMESQNQLLKHMKISYYTALGVLATLIILSKTPCGPPPGKCSAFLGIKDTDDLKCNKQNSKELTRAMKTIKTIITDIGGTLLIIQQGFSVIKSLTSLHQVSPEFNRVVVAHREEVNFMMSLIRAMESLLYSTSFAQSGKISTDSNGDDMNTTFIDSAGDWMGENILSPYVRLGLYASMGVITSLITERNDKDIKVYTEKIDNFDKELQDLKTNIGKNLVSEDDKNKDEKEQFKFNESTFADGANGCLVRRANGKIDYDPSCLCKKTNTCASVYDTLGKDTLKDNKEANELLSTLDKVYSGDSSYVDDKLKSDNLLNMATKFAQNSVGKLNETLASQGEGTIDLNKAVERSVGALLSDVSNPKGKKLAVGAGPSVAAKASKGSSSRGDSGVPDYFSGLGSAGGASGGNQGGIHLKTEITEEVDLQDIHPTPEESLFEVISLRYQKSIMQHYIKNSTPER